MGPQGRGPRRLPGNGEGGEPSVPCPSGPTRKRHWRTWRLREASAAAEGGGDRKNCRALRKARHSPRRFASTSGPGSRARTVMSGRGRSCQKCAGAGRNVRRRNTSDETLFPSHLKHSGSKTQRGGVGRSRLISRHPLAAQLGDDNLAAGNSDL